MRGRETLKRSGCLRNFELVSVVGLVSLATILVASLARARQGRRDARWQTIPTASQTRTVGLPVTVAAFILAIFSQDVWTVMGRTQAANVVILLLLACLLAMYLACRPDPDQHRFPELTLSVAGTAVISFGIFYASGFLLVDPQTAVDWAGASIDCYTPCDATITGLVGGEQARLAGLFAAVSVVSTADALSILPPKSSAEARVRERLRGDVSPRSRRPVLPASMEPLEPSGTVSRTTPQVSNDHAMPKRHSRSVSSSSAATNMAFGRSVCSRAIRRTAEGHPRRRPAGPIGSFARRCTSSSRSATTTSSRRRSATSASTTEARA